MDLARPKKNEAEKAWLTRISEPCARAVSGDAIIIGLIILMIITKEKCKK